MQPFDLFGQTTGIIQPIFAMVVTYVTVILFVRIAGVRTFANMSAFDFAATIAVGSLIATTAIGHAPLWSGLVAIAALFASQAAVSRLRRGSWRGVVDNRPIVLMEGGRVLEDNLRRAGMIEADLSAQLRRAGLRSRDQVQAMVLETTGDVSVIAGEGGLDALDPLARGDLRL